MMICVSRPKLNMPFSPGKLKKKDGVGDLYSSKTRVTTEQMNKRKPK